MVKSKKVTETKPPQFEVGDRVAKNKVKRSNYSYDDDDYLQEEFYNVKVAPYKHGGKWLMVINGKFLDKWDDLEQGEKEVMCRDYHFVGQRAPEVPSLSKKIGDKLVETAQKKNMKPAIVTAIVLGVLFFLGVWVIGNYNSLVGAKNEVSNSRAKIDTQLERRYELVDNIVESVKGSQAQESDVFGKIAAARKIGGDSGASTEQKAEANQTIDTQIALLPRLQEAYPELRSNDQVSKLIGELQGTANTIASTRNDYNDTVTNYNNNITRFPKSVFAGVFNYDKEELFKASNEAKVNPKVDLKRD